MKNMLRILFILLAIIVIALFAFTALVKNEVADMLNPLIPKTSVYVKIDGTAKEVEGPRYEYTLSGYEKSGDVRTVTFSASKKLREGAYIRLTTKRSYVKEWEEVPYDTIPEDAKEKL
ncbi:MULTISPECIES: YxeA family protein [Virgibacillus]|uniref:YxeA family protein n=1 Tax=Virgibacillus TaxID=84406 RepID=UPI000685423D|nr:MULTISPECIES: YxeA family protein [Bacillaceae]WBX79388.1 YxeA family protein [Virgibacillus salarius]